MVKQVGGGNVFNNRKPQRHVAPMEAHGDGMLPLPRFCLRSTLRLPTSVPLGTQNLFPMASPLPRLAKPLVATITSAASLPVKRKAEAQEAWVGPLGCGCADARAHKAYSRKCAKWACACKLPRGAGGDFTHHTDCPRGRFQQHVEQYYPPKAGDKVAMVGDKRLAGMPDVVYDGRVWVTDPDGRAIIRSAWVQGALL